MIAEIETIKELIAETNPKAYQALKASGELDGILEEYEQMIREYQLTAAMEARKSLESHDPLKIEKTMMQAKREAGETVLAEIREEIERIYQVTTD